MTTYSEDDELRKLTRLITGREGAEFATPTSSAFEPESDAGDQGFLTLMRTPLSQALEQIAIQGDSQSLDSDTSP